MQVGRLTLCVGMLSFILCGSADAQLLVDYSPATTGGTSTTDAFINGSASQNFAERFSFLSSATATGMDVYTKVTGSILNRTATIRLWSGTSAAPQSLLSEFTQTITQVDTVGSSGSNERRAHVNFSTPLLLNANTTYWIGMSGASGFNLGQDGLLGNFPDDSRMAQFDGTTFQFITTPDTGDMAFRLQGTFVPEPVFPLIIGAVMTFMSMRRRS